jgi:hypothetical protein
MPDFIDGNSTNSTKAEVKVIENTVDTNNIANAVIKAIMSKMPHGFNNTSANKESSDFDNTVSLEKLANAMTIQGKNESNLEGLGTTKETKKDKTQTDNTIDMLSQLGD